VATIHRILITMACQIIIVITQEVLTAAPLTFHRAAIFHTVHHTAAIHTHHRPVIITLTHHRTQIIKRFHWSLVQQYL